jgi:O-antigen ligase
MSCKKYLAFNYIGILFFVLFVHSGLVKWINIWPIDPTILFGVITLFPLFVVSLKRKNYITFKELILIFMFCTFSIWFFLSMLYSISNDYVYEKARNYLLIIFSFFVPILTIKNEDDIKFYLSIFAIIGITISIVIYVSYIMGGMDLSTYYFKAMEAGREIPVPDYLALGVPVGTSTIILLLSQKIWLKLIGIITFPAMILLAGRGPFIAIFFVLFVFTVSRFRFTKKNLIVIVVSPFFLVYTFNTVTNWSGAERLVSRIEVVGQREDYSLKSRISQLDRTKELIQAKPIFGIGLGSFGLNMFGRDIRAYPHNMLIEIFVEQGLIGFILIILFLSIFLLIIWRNHFFSINALLFIPSVCLLFEFINILKSSSIIDNRSFFMLVAICIASHKFYRKRALSKSNITK